MHWWLLFLCKGISLLQFHGKRGICLYRYFKGSLAAIRSQIYRNKPKRCTRCIQSGIMDNHPLYTFLSHYWCRIGTSTAQRLRLRRIYLHVRQLLIEKLRAAIFTRRHAKLSCTLNARHPAQQSGLKYKWLPLATIYYLVVIL